MNIETPEQYEKVMARVTELMIPPDESLTAEELEELKEISAAAEAYEKGNFEPVGDPSFVGAFRYLLGTRDMTMTDFARETGLSLSLVSRVASGAANPSRKFYDAVQKVFGAASTAALPVPAAPFSDRTKEGARSVHIYPSAELRAKLEEESVREGRTLSQIVLRRLQSTANLEIPQPGVVVDRENGRRYAFAETRPEGLVPADAVLWCVRFTAPGRPSLEIWTSDFNSKAITMNDAYEELNLVGRWLLQNSATYG